MNKRAACRSILMIAAALYVCVFVLINFIAPVQYKRCDLYTREMNGGLRTIQGNTYNIVLCGFRGRIEPDNVFDDEVRLQVFSSDGELLAQRFIEPLFGMGRDAFELEYGTDYLIYNDGEGGGFGTSMSMPPSRLEWLRARLPRFAPLIFWP